MAVTKNDINNALSGIEENPIDCYDWLRLVEQYPYCEIFVWHYLRTLYRANDISFDSELQRLGIRLGNRQGFYNFMVRRPSSKSLFSYNTVSSDYFADKGQEGLSLSELARKLRAVRISATQQQEHPFCTPNPQKNDIPEDSSATANEVKSASKKVKTANNKPNITQQTTSEDTAEDSQNPDSLQFIRAKITSLIMQKKYSEALEILKRENFANSKKNAYFAVQIKYLETIINNK